MKEDITAPGQNTVPPPVEEATPTSTAKLLIENAKPISINLWHKFYSNKKIFIPVVIFFAIVFLIIILGLLFGSKNKPPPAIPRVTSTPFILSTPIASPSSEFLGQKYQQLLDLKAQIDGLDVKQSRLQPPGVNFEIKF